MIIIGKTNLNHLEVGIYEEEENIYLANNLPPISKTLLPQKMIQNSTFVFSGLDLYFRVLSGPFWTNQVTSGLNGILYFF